MGPRSMLFAKVPPHVPPQPVADEDRRLHRAANLSGGRCLRTRWPSAACCGARCWRPAKTHVGILLPPSVAAVLSNAALTLDRRVAVNLNYTVTSEVLNASIAQCGIRHVLTSRRMLDRFPLKLDAEMVFVEELKQRMTWSDKLAAAAAWLLPAAVLERWLGLSAVRPDDVADGHVHVRLDRRAQGRDADTCQHRVQSCGIDSLIHISPQRRPAGRAADVPLLRLHGHALDRADARPQGRLPLHAAGTAADRRALPQARLHDPDCHAHVSAGLSAPLRAGGPAFAGRRLRRGGEAPARIWPPPSRSASACCRSKATGPRSFRRSSPETSRPPRPIAGQVGQPHRHDRPAPARHRGQGDRSGQRARIFPAGNRACCWSAART